MDTDHWVEAGHLGGYIPGGDPDTLYPELFDWMANVWKIKTLIDVGCGDGAAIREFRARGISAWGVEGISQESPYIDQHDYTTEPYEPDQEFDVCWSAEFVEHVEEQYVPNFLATFQSARFVMMTHGTPGSPGYHHVNNQPSDYWKGAMAAIGYQFDETQTALTRMISSANTRPLNHYRATGMVFRRYE